MVRKGIFDNSLYESDITLMLCIMQLVNQIRSMTVYRRLRLRPPHIPNSIKLRVDSKG